MTQIGIVRKIDSLGRVTLPKEFRRVSESRRFYVKRSLDEAA